MVVYTRGKPLTCVKEILYANPDPVSEEDFRAASLMETDEGKEAYLDATEVLPTNCDLCDVLFCDAIIVDTGMLILYRFCPNSTIEINETNGWGSDEPCSNQNVHVTTINVWLT